MEIYITLDYELYFGAQSGTAQNCILKPTQALLDILEPYNIKFTCFVDSGYLLALKKHKEKHPQLASDLDKISDQIKYLSSNGHGIELHVHPHWEDSSYDGEKWVCDTSRYKLSDFSEDEVLDIVTRYNSILKEITGVSPVAFRAGGWCAQPFGPIKKALEANNIFIDSTVYPNGFYNSKNQVFDFRGVPQYKTQYRFSDCLTNEDATGNFTEIPISSFKPGPAFFWRFALAKILKRKKHNSFGDGSAVRMNKKGMIRLLTKSSYTVVSIDGYKAKLLEKSFGTYIKNTLNTGNFVIIGHPKAFTAFSLEKLEKFIIKNSTQHQFTTYDK